LREGIADGRQIGEGRKLDDLIGGGAWGRPAVIPLIPLDAGIAPRLAALEIQPVPDGPRLEGKAGGGEIEPPRIIRHPREVFDWPRERHYWRS
jgi:hypothetical protein